jgi:hypothetical protein
MYVKIGERKYSAGLEYKSKFGKYGGEIIEPHPPN